MALSNQFEMLRDLVARLIEYETRIFVVRREEALENVSQATPDEIAEYHRERELAERQLAESCADCLAFGASIGIESEELATGLSTLQTNVLSLTEWQSTQFRPVWSYAEDRSMGGWLSAEEKLRSSVRKAKVALTQPVFLRLAAQVAERRVDGLNAEMDDLNGDVIADEERKLSRSVLAVRGAYEWALTKIDGADELTIAKLFDAIQSHPDMTSEFLDHLPDKAETFGKYLKRAGIDRYNSSGARARRPSRRPRT